MPKDPVSHYEQLMKKFETEDKNGAYAGAREGVVRNVQKRREEQLRIAEEEDQRNRALIPKQRSSVTWNDNEYIPRSGKAEAAKAQEDSEDDDEEGEEGEEEEEEDPYKCEPDREMPTRGNGGPSYRDWMITFWPEEPVVPVPKVKGNVSFYCGQCEICPDTKKLHGHIYIELKAPRTKNFLKAIFDDNTMHCEPRKGTQEQAIKYATKEDTRHPDCAPMKWGKKKRQGYRSDLDNLAAGVCQGMTKIELLREFKGNALRHMGCIERAQQCAWGRNFMDNYIHGIREAAAKQDKDPRDVVPSDDQIESWKRETPLMRRMRIAALEAGDDWDEETLMMAEKRKMGGKGTSDSSEEDEDDTEMGVREKSSIDHGDDD